MYQSSSQKDHQCVNLLMNLKNPRYRGSLVTLEKKRKNVLQDLKLPSTRNAICLWVRCCVSTSDVFWYFCCHNICFRIYWLNTIFHFWNEMLLKYPFILYVFDQLEIWEVLKHKGLSRKVLIRNNGNLADVVKIPDFLAFIRLCIPSI